MKITKNTLRIAVVIAAFPFADAVYAAATDSATVDLTATVPGVCYIADATFDTNVNLSDKIDSTTALLDTSVSGTTPKVVGYCNNAGTIMRMASANKGIMLPSAPIAQAGVFAGTTVVNDVYLPYTVSADWEGVGTDANFVSDGEISTDPTLNTPVLSSGGPINGTITLTINLNDQSTNPVLAGTYTDTLTVQIATTP